MQDIIKNVKGIDGIECNYSSFTKEQTTKLEKFCQENHLLKTGGSDYHGKLKPNINFGRGTENEKIQEKIINEWI